MSIFLDSDAIADRLEKKTAAAWRDGAGNGLLHHAARLGDPELVEQCIAGGLSPHVYNKEGECARDIARSWGHDAVADYLDERMALAAPPAASFPYKSLKELRVQEENLFHHYAKRGMFHQIAALAERDGEGLKASDILTRGSDGDTALLHICQQNELELLLKPELWSKNPADFDLVWSRVPTAYKEEADTERLVTRAQQMKLKAQSMKWKGPL